MKTNVLIFRLLALAFVLTMSYGISTAQSECGSSDTEKVKDLLNKALECENAGDEAGHDKAMNEIARMHVELLENYLQQPIPAPNGTYCDKDNAMTDYIGCLLKLTARVELTAGSDDLTKKGMDKVNEAIDKWTTNFAYSVPPSGNEELCKKYLACIFKAMAQRELTGIPHSETDEILKARADEIMKKGCKKCETSWMAMAKVDISWRTDDETVNIAGNAGWDNFYIIVNMSELEDNCMTIVNDDRYTFPYACDGGVVSHKGGKFNPRLQLIQANSTFATEMVGADLILCSSDTHNPADLRINCYMGFDNHGQQFNIPIADKVQTIKKRKPFTVTATETNEEVPSYTAKLKIMFFPVWK